MRAAPLAGGVSRCLVVLGTPRGSEGPVRKIRASAPLLRLYRRLARNVSEGLACDNTVYGLGRASPQSFLPHHTAALSAAVVEEDARAVCSAAASLDARETGLRDR